MEKVISIKHDESVVENPCLHRVAQEWAARLGVSQMAASQILEERSMESARRMHGLEAELLAEVGDNQQRLRKPPR